MNKERCVCGFGMGGEEEADPYCPVHGEAESRYDYAPQFGEEEE